VKEFATDKIRNVCLAGQRGCGKTSLADAIAFNVGVNNRVGRVDDGSSFFDHTDGEVARKSTLLSKLLACSWQGKKINLLDCPGHADFTGELISAAHVCDGVVLLVDAVSGVEVGTSLQWKAMPQTGLARFFLVNKMDKENVKWKTALESVQKAFGNKAVAIQVPIGESEKFRGVIDLFRMKAFVYDGDKQQETDIPADLKADAQARRDSLIEVAAESDDALMEKFFEAGTLDEADLMKGIKSGIASGKLFPVMFGSGQRNIGAREMLDLIAEYIPAPNQMPPLTAVKTGTTDEVAVPCDPSGKTVAHVFKLVSEGHLGDMTYFKLMSGTLKPGMELTNQQKSVGERFAALYTFQGKNRDEVPVLYAGDIGVAVKLRDTHIGNTLTDKDMRVTIKPAVYPNPVMDVAIRPKSKGDEEKVASGLTKLRDEDPTFQLIADPALRQQVLWAQGSTHIEVLMDKLQKRFGVQVTMGKPRIPYRETVTTKAEKQYRHKKQSGGRGQYGDVYIRLEPNTRGGGFEFLDEIKGGVIPGKFIPAVEKGVVEAMERGGLCGAIVVDVKVALYFGSYHDVDSSDMAFKIAGLMAFREAFIEAKPVILEPIYTVEVLVPDEFTGDVMGDLSSRRGKIAGMEPETGSQRIRATIPQSELYEYSVDLRSMTQGQGVYTMQFSHYETVPHETAQKIIAEAKAEQAAEG
jgi:elongation factor G